MEDKTLIILAFTIATIMVFTLYLFVTPEGAKVLHEHTNIVCNMAYNDDLNSWRFAANSTENNNFIEECMSRGIGK